jgi:hypothetical protein
MCVSGICASQKIPSSKIQPSVVYTHRYDDPSPVKCLLHNRIDLRAGGMLSSFSFSLPFLAELKCQASELLPPHCLSLSLSKPVSEPAWPATRPVLHGQAAATQCYLFFLKGRTVSVKENSFMSCHQVPLDPSKLKFMDTGVTCCIILYNIVKLLNFLSSFTLSTPHPPLHLSHKVFS